MMDIQKIIDGCKHCIDKSEYSCACVGCPYANNDECIKNLRDDAVNALGYLQSLEQPKLPGIEPMSLSEEMNRQNLYCRRIIQIEHW